jgi:hypothetical protein
MSENDFPQGRERKTDAKSHALLLSGAGGGWVCCSLPVLSISAAWLWDPMKPRRGNIDNEVLAVAEELEPQPTVQAACNAALTRTHRVPSGQNPPKSSETPGTQVRLTMALDRLLEQLPYARFARRQALRAVLVIYASHSRHSCTP